MTEEEVVFQGRLFAMSMFEKHSGTSPISIMSPWCWDDFLEQCFNILKSTNGPVFYENRELKNYDASKKLLIPKETQCIIEIRNYKQKSIKNGCGCYYGYGHVLTALHVVEDANPYHSNMLAIFKTEEVVLVYKAKFEDSCNRDKAKDQAFIKLYGDTTPLGEGLHNQVGKTNKNGVFFRTVDADGNFRKREGQICRPNSNIRKQMCPGEFIMNVAGEAGDSGSPVFNTTTGELIGVYRGVFTSHEKNNKKTHFGRYTEISPNFSPWRQMTSSVFADLIKDIIYYFVRFLVESNPNTPVVSD
ncbi:uncharacterized protein LOC124384085 [Silurus meridionalis]|uniref:uncharacterized protein LOC124384085 n=1 Tax=Silurus meridionalis TaxID=175797 RepID=UPI001EEB2745|nr:uncharacterized protein LOC124384085 [Silurus meridionalis]